MKIPHSFVGLCVLALGTPLASSQISSEAQSLVDRYNNVTGGTEAKQDIRSMLYEGTWEMPQQELSGPAKIYIEQGVKFGLFLEIPEIGTIRNCYADGKAWIENPFVGTRSIEGSEFEQMGKNSILFPELHLEQFYPYAQIQEHRDPSQRKVLLRDSRGFEETWFFDAKTGLLSEVQSTIDAGVQGSFVIRLRYADYLRVGELLLAHRFMWQTPAYQVDIRIRHIEINPEIPDELFQAPAEAAEAPAY